MAGPASALSRASHADLLVVAESGGALVRTDQPAGHKRGSFTRVTDLMRRIHEFTREYIKDASPFVWAATAESILAKIERLSTRICDSRH